MVLLLDVLFLNVQCIIFLLTNSKYVFILWFWGDLTNFLV